MSERIKKICPDCKKPFVTVKNAKKCYTCSMWPTPRNIKIAICKQCGEQLTHNKDQTCDLCNGIPIDFHSNNELSKIYFIQDKKSNAIKIGLSTNPRRRLRSIQAYNPNVLHLLLTLDTDNPKKTERLLHEKFQKCHIHGEWFKETMELRSFIEEGVNA